MCAPAAEHQIDPPVPLRTHLFDARYLPPGVVKTVNPGRGQGGTVVTIAGTNLFGGGSKIKVMLAGVYASIRASSNTQVVVVALASSKSSEGDVVLHADTGAVVTKVNAFTYLEAGRILSVTPAKGTVEEQ